MNRRNVRILFCLGLFGQVAWGQNKDLNTITSVEIHGGRIEIVGTKQPSFTSFTMTDPARLVIDIAEAVFSGVPDQIPGSGSVSWIKTASYGSDSSAIARVLIGFSQDVETDVASPGNKLVIKILSSAPPAVARTDKPTGTTPKESAAEKPKEVGASAGVQTAKETAMKSEEERLAQERAQKEAAKREEQERLAEARRVEAEKKRQAEEESKRLADQNHLTEQQKRIEAEVAKREAAAEEKRKAQEERL
ncbi:MAG TPA: AMIN domain-containing protein, partial [Myxococcaceae bacterium]|nr:AMIN domain-containing protein [Myxococcaceae bacterium]